MKQVRVILSAVMMTSIMLSSCGGGESKEVTIGNQVWMTENLNVDTFRNGDPIPEAKTDEEWKNATDNKQPAWCYYENDPAIGAKYGKLYNWYAVKDPRRLAPEGWHVPSAAEWEQLIDYLGGNDCLGCNSLVSAPKMRSTSGWTSATENGTNKSGFSGLPGGRRPPYGTFYGVDGSGSFWSSWSLGSTRDRAWSIDLYEYVELETKHKGFGLSVRCIRD